MRARAATLCLTVVFGVSAGERPGDWNGPYDACDGHAELSKPDHMSLGVRFATSKARVATAFARAMSFWADVLDMEWHTRERSRMRDSGCRRPRRAFRACAIGTRAVSHGAIVSGLDRVQPENDAACQPTFHNSRTRDRAPLGVTTQRESIFGHVFSATRWTGVPRQRRCFRLGGAPQAADGGVLVSVTLG